MKKKDLSRLQDFADDSQNASFFFEDLARDLENINPLGPESLEISKSLKGISARIDNLTQKMRVAGLTDERKQVAVQSRRDTIGVAG